MWNRRYRGSLAVCILLIGYASLYPFWPLRAPGEEALAGFFLKPRYLVGFDIALNFVAYVPLGAIACLYLRGGETHPILRSVALGAALSFALETCQLFVPSRVASIFDVMANTAGSLVGAWAFAEPIYAAATKPLGELRERLVIAGRWGDAGLALVALWLIAQLNPALPFFGAGDIGPEGAREIVHGALQWAAVALGICGFGLFVSAILVGPAGALRATLALLSVALWLKFVAGSFMLKPNVSAEWLNAGRLGGLAAGIAVFIPLRRLGRPARIYIALVLVLAGALLAKIFGAYSATDELLRVFSWPYGQLENFTSLTRSLHELWPFLAIAYLVALFFHARRHRMQP